MSTIRRAVCAGRFYPGSEGVCREMLDEMLAGVSSPKGRGAIVPHAGWVYSGRTAALAWAGIAAAKPETVVIFGAAHGPDHHAASVFSSGAWETPLGTLHVDEELALGVISRGPAVDSLSAHVHEHSVEVQIPFIQRLLPDARIVPVVVQAGPAAVEVGRACGREVAESGRRVAFAGSTDLTHYGPAFGFEPHGRGRPGVRWAMEVNDRRFVALIDALDEAGVVPEAAANRNACGAGAVAATIAAMRELGVDRYQELQHTCSAEIERAAEPDPANSVGYEAGIFS